MAIVNPVQCINKNNSMKGTLPTYIFNTCCIKNRTMLWMIKPRKRVIFVRDNLR